MQVLVALAAVLGAVALWYWRLRTAREAAGELAGAASEVRLAARRFAYRRRHNRNPIDCVDDPRLAAAGIALAIAAIDQPLSRAELDAMREAAIRVFGATARDADDIVAFGRWIAGQAKTPEEAVRRLTRAVRNTAGPEVGAELVELLETVASADGGELGLREQQAISRVTYDLRP